MAEMLINFNTKLYETARRTLTEHSIQSGESIMSIVNRLIVDNLPTYEVKVTVKYPNGVSAVKSAESCEADAKNRVSVRKRPNRIAEKTGGAE